MSLLEEARAIRLRPPGPLCNLQRALAAHPDHAADIIAVVRDRTIAHKTAADVFRAHGIRVGAQVVQGHRQDGCSQCAYYGTDISAAGA